MADEDNPFAKYKFGSSAAQQPAQAAPQAPINPENPFEGRKFKAETPAAPAQAPVQEPIPDSTPEGYKKAVTSGVMQGAASIPGQLGDMPGMMFSIPAAIGEGVLSGVEAGRKYFTGKEKAEDPRYLANVEEAKKVLERMRGYGEDMRHYNLPSIVSEYLGGPKLAMPTTQEITSAANPYAEQYFGVGPEYEPKALGEKRAKEAASFATQSVAGPGKLIPRVISGAASGLGSALAGEYAEGTAGEIPARIAGAIAGGLAPGALGKAAQFTFAPQTLAKPKLAQTLESYDIEAAKPTQILATSIDRQDLSKAAAGIPDRIRAFGRRLTGVDQDMPTFQKILDEQGLAERNRVYDIARANKNAENIPLDLIGDLVSRPTFREAEERAIRFGLDNPNLGIVPRSETSAGNLRYLDQVKKELDKMYATGADRETLTSIRKNLIQKLDDHIPEYGSARDAASETFHASSAPQAGKNFMSNIDSMKQDAIETAMKQYSPSQRQAFNVGVMQDIFDRVDKGQLSSITKDLLTKPIFQEKLRTALGDQNYDVLRGKLLSENMLSKAHETAVQMAKREGLSVPQPLMSGLVAGASTFGASQLVFELQAAQSLLEMLNVKPSAALLGVAVGVTKGGADYLKNAADRRVIGTMFSLLQREDPKAFAELSQLANKRPDIYKAVIAPLSITASQRGEEEEAPASSPQAGQVGRVGQGRPTQWAKGGRVNRATGGRIQGLKTAEMLMRAAHNAKTKISKVSEAILDEPDEAVVKALDIASKHI